MENGFIHGNKRFGINVNESYISLKNVTIYDNELGIEIDTEASIDIVQSTVWNDSIVLNHGNGVSISNSIIWSNIIINEAFGVSKISYSNFRGGMKAIEDINAEHSHPIINWGDGNIYTDPLFIDPENGDFRLSPDSPCIDAGKIPTNSEYYGSAPDMGAHESNYTITSINTGTEPVDIMLYHNHPNPFNPITTISYELPKDSFVRLNIFSVNG
ncbi:MAG: hypothetical protein JXB48_04190 [Candidatus Latescibacteria bacterium]|nr:hypothetical protein [Candidatus Latescibacterota bacterium]